MLKPTPEVEPVPCCCWCNAPVVLKNRIGWCSGSKACRQRQMACGVQVTLNGKRKWLFVPTPSQTEVMEATDTNLFVHSNRGSGKSHVLRWMCHALALAIPGYKYAILRTSFPELTLNHLIFLKDEMDSMGGEANGYYYHKTEHICYYPNGSMGFYRQAETDEQVKNVLGVEMYLCVFDEAPTFKWNHMAMIAASVRVPAGSGLKPLKRYLGNPIGACIDELWMYFIDKDVDPLNDPEYRPEEWRAIKLRLEDNVHLDIVAYRKSLAGAGLPEHIRKAWLDGERADERAMFAFFPNKDGKPYHVVAEFPRWGLNNQQIAQRNEFGVWHFPDWVKIYRAFDMGWAPDPAVCVWFAIIGKRILVFKEKTWLRTIAADIAQDMVKESKGMHIAMTYCDPTIDIKTGADILTIRDTFENNGVPMEPSVNSREHYAHAIHSALQSEVEWGSREAMTHVPRIQFLQGNGVGVPLTIKYLPMMRYDDKNPMEMADHRHDHLPIACAYFLMSVIPTTKAVDVGPPKRWMQPKKGERKVLGSNNVRRRYAK